MTGDNTANNEKFGRLLAKLLDIDFVRLRSGLAEWPGLPEMNDTERASKTFAASFNELADDAQLLQQKTRAVMAALITEAVNGNKSKDHQED